MLPTTQEAIRAMLKADPSLTTDDRGAILAAIRNHGRPQAGKADAAPAPVEVLRRGEVAAMLKRGPRSIDRLARAGVLRKVKLPGMTRAVGFNRVDVEALIEGK